MTAHGERDMSAKVSVMMPAANKIIECLLQIMQHAGISKLKVVSHDSSGLRKTCGEIELFACAPKSVAEYAMSVKDAIAEIVASIGFMSVEIRAAEEDMAGLANFYNQVDTLYNIPGYKNTIQADMPAPAASSAADDGGAPGKPTGTAAGDKKPDGEKAEDVKDAKDSAGKPAKPAVRISRKCRKSSCRTDGK